MNTITHIRKMRTLICAICSFGALGALNVAHAQAQPQQGAGAAPSPSQVASNPTPGNAQQTQQALANEKLAEMNAKMIAAFDRIAAEYGNPTIIRVFTNDPEKGEELKQRLALLQDVEKLRAEKGSLVKAVSSLKADKALRVEELASLDARINKHRIALAAFVRLADEAEKAFAAIGQENMGGANPGQQSGSATVNSPSAVASAAANSGMAIDPTAYDAH